METRHKSELLKLCGSSVRFDCSLAPRTTLGVGGKADALYEAQEIGELRKVVAFLHRESIPALILGRGSNLLVKDTGVEGVTIRLSGHMAQVSEQGSERGLMWCGGGLALRDLLNHCRREGLGGLEFLAGVPGSVGGAVSTNSGAFGGCIGSRVKKVRVVRSNGEIVELDRKRLRFSYRTLEMEEGGIIAEVLLGLDPEPPESVREKISGYVKRRRSTQPLDRPSAGSIFKNPPGDYAGRLIEQAGLKGKRIGGAMISEKHTNFILNVGDASAGDILALIRLVQERVKQSAGVELELEVRVVGR